MGFAVFVDHRKIYGENSKDIAVIFSQQNRWIIDVKSVKF